jgi:hypothetical protein
MRLRSHLEARERIPIHLHGNEDEQKFPHTSHEGYFQIAQEFPAVTNPVSLLYLGNNKNPTIKFSLSNRLECADGNRTKFYNRKTLLLATADML